MPATGTTMAFKLAAAGRPSPLATHQRPPTRRPGSCRSDVHRRSTTTTPRQPRGGPIAAVVQSVQRILPTAGQYANGYAPKPLCVGGADDAGDVLAPTADPLAPTGPAVEPTE